MKYLDAFLKFIRDLFIKDKPTSSKRFFGAIGFITVMIFIALWDHELINELMYTSAALIGLDSISKISKS